MRFHVIALLALSVCLTQGFAYAQGVPPLLPPQPQQDHEICVYAGHTPMCTQSFDCGVALGKALRMHATVEAPDAECAGLMAQALQLQSQTNEAEPPAFPMVHRVQ